MRGYLAYSSPLGARSARVATYRLRGAAVLTLVAMLWGVAPTHASPPAALDITGASVQAAPASPGNASGPDGALPNGLRKEVFGFLPYWMLDASELQWMRYDLLSTIAYFGVGARSDGTLATNTPSWNGWVSSAMTGVISAAHARGVKVVVSITMMAWDGGAQQAALLGSATARTRLVNAIVATVRNRNADGVNLDFEPVYPAQRDQYTSFVRQLKAALRSAGVGSYLTVCTTAGAATWATGYDLQALVASGAADAIFVMGYDYSWSGSARAGGVAPMDSPYILDVNDSVADFLQLIPGSKIIWGAPYYGRTWRTTTSSLNSSTVSGAASKSVAYYYTGNLSLAGKHGRLWDSVGKVPWFRYYDSAAGSWVQGYYDDAQSLAYKWDMVNQRGLAGAGIWHLLMDMGRSELWNLLANKFKTDTSPPTGGIASLPPAVDGLGVLVRWNAIDVGSGVASYSVQARDRAGGSWTPWLTDSTATAATWAGKAGHAYEFRVSAVDTRGNRQPWAGDAPDPGSALTIGGFATAAVDSLNVRSGAGTGFGVLDVLSAGARVAVMAGPIAAGGYSWYQVQFAFAEWPSADYPRIGWVAGAGGGTPYLTPAVPPTVTTLQPVIAGYTPQPRRISPNGDGYLDVATVSYTLPEAATSATLDVLDASGAVVRSEPLGAQPAGGRVAAWDGRLQDASGPWAANGAYLLRVTATLPDGSHVAPVAAVDAWALRAWGVTADLVAPTVATRSPDGSSPILNPVVAASLSEPVEGVGADSLTVVDTLTTTPVAGVVGYDGPSRRVTFTLNAPLRAGRLYTATVGAGLHDTVGNPLAPTSWDFATAPATGRAVRLAGADRYATAAAISAATFDPGVPAVFVATGATFADALAGSAAAARLRAPILLVKADELPAATANELTRLQPGRIFVLGGQGAVSEKIVASLGAYTRPTSGIVTRLAGVDRYATAAAISAATFEPGVDYAFVATGENFPDGLAAGAAAGLMSAPLLLVHRDTVPVVTATELARLAPAHVVVVGGEGTVSGGVFAALGGYAGVDIERVAGTDRYATAAAIAARFFDPAVIAAYVSTGLNYPDALAAGSAAASWGGPLLLVKPAALPAATAAELDRLNPRAIFIGGGVSAVSNSVQTALSRFPQL